MKSSTLFCQYLRYLRYPILGSDYSLQFRGCSFTMEMRSVVRDSSLPVYSWPIWSDRQLGEVEGFQSYPGRSDPLVVALNKASKAVPLKWRFFLPPSRFKALLYLQLLHFPLLAVHVPLMPPKTASFLTFR